MDITKTNTDLMIKKYPFLEKFVDNTVAEVRVEKIDLGLLRETPYTRYAGNGLGHSLSFVLINNAGEEILVVKPAGYRRIEKFSIWSLKTWFPSYIYGEMVGDAIARIQDTEEVAYILEDKYWPRDVLGPPGHKNITLHKLPRHTKVVEHIKNLQARMVDAA